MEEERVWQRGRERGGGERRICLEERAQQTAPCFSSSSFFRFFYVTVKIERESRLDLTATILCLNFKVILTKAVNWPIR
jgi:hypothetical protein